MADNSSQLLRVQSRRSCHVYRQVNLLMRDEMKVWLLIIWLHTFHRLSFQGTDFKCVRLPRNDIIYTNSTDVPNKTTQYLKNMFCSSWNFFEFLKGIRCCSVNARIILESTNHSSWIAFVKRFELRQYVTSSVFFRYYRLILTELDSRERIETISATPEIHRYSQIWTS